MLCSRALTLLSAPANAVSEVENISYETEARIDAKNVVVQPDVHSLRTRINRAHHRHLRRPFLKIVLIDTEGVDPYPERLIRVSEQADGPVKRLGDAYLYPIHLSLSLDRDGYRL